MPPRPTPLITKGHGHVIGSSKSPFSPLPSELPRTPIGGHFEALKSHDEAMKTPITPPTAYTDFLKLTVNSPAIASSPRSLHALPYSPAPTSASGQQRTYSHHGYYTPATPYPPQPSTAVKRSFRGMPPSPQSAKTSPKASPVTESPRSAGSASSASSSSSSSSRSAAESESESESESEDEEREAAARTDGRVTVKQVVTTTVTYTPRTMSLMPAPKGKRRRIA